MNIWYTAMLEFITCKQRIKDMNDGSLGKTGPTHMTAYYNLPEVRFTNGIFHEYCNLSFNLGTIS